MCAAVRCMSWHTYITGDSGSLYSGPLVEFIFYILYMSISLFIHGHYIYSFLYVLHLRQSGFSSPLRRGNNHREDGNSITLYMLVMLTFLLLFITYT